jgi:hypothetical protein
MGQILPYKCEMGSLAQREENRLRSVSTEAEGKYTINAVLHANVLLGQVLWVLIRLRNVTIIG